MKISIPPYAGIACRVLLDYAFPFLSWFIPFIQETKELGSTLYDRAVVVWCGIS